MNHRRYLVLGSGVAGIGAVEAIRAADPAGEITIISADPFGYYSRPGLAYYLSGELGEDLLYPMQKKDFRAINLRWVQAKVAQIQPTEHRVVLENNAVLPYDRLLIATGSTAAPLGVPGADLEGVFKLDDMTDARAILKAARKARSAVVIGGGITALELAEGLRAHKLHVEYLLRSDRYWPNVLDETESDIIEDRLRHEGIDLYHNTKVIEVLGKKGRVFGVHADTVTSMCDMVCYAIGVQPRKALAEQAGLQVDRGILVNEYMQTSDPDIYAAGDVAQVFDPFSGQSVLDTLWNTARMQGQFAGQNMSGSQVPYRKEVPLNVTRLAGLTTTIIGTVGRGVDASLVGIARGDSETWRHLPEAVVAEQHFEVNRLRLLLGAGDSPECSHILGAVVMGDQTLSVPLQELINSRADISPIRDMLLRSEHLADIILSFWETWSVGHAAAQS